MGSASSIQIEEAAPTINATHAVAKFKRKQELAQNTEAAAVEDEENKEKELIEKHPELKDVFDRFEDINESLKNKSLDERSLIRSINDNIYDAYGDFGSKEQRMLMGNHMAKIDLVKSLSDHYTFLLKDHHLESVTDIETGTFFGATLLILRGIFWNYSDASLKFAESVGMPEYLECILKDLDDIDKGQKAGTIDIEEQGPELALKSALGCIHNCAKSDTLRPIFHELKAVNRLKPFMQTSETENKAVAIMTMAYIINDEQNDILATNAGVFEFIIDMLRQALESEDSRHEGFSAWELAKGLAAMARNDQNKILIAEKGAIPSLSKMLVSEDEEEIEEALNTLWKLGFDQNNKKKIQDEPHCVDRVKGLRNHNNTRITKAAHGVMWILNQNQLNSQDISGESFFAEGGEESGEAAEKAGHVMISYNWGYQRVIKQVKDKLKGMGFNVWMDIEQMGGSTLQAMAEAVENSAVVLICMSDGYKDSPNCRTEAEYAFSLRKDIVPLMMQRNYKPDGWLGMILGSKLFFDFSGKYNFDTKINDLAKELGSRGKTGEIVPIAETAVLAPSFGTGNKNPSHWNKEDVANWMEKTKLNRIKQFKSLNGEQIAFFKEMFNNVPEFFFDYMTNKMGITEVDDLILVNSAYKNL